VICYRPVPRRACADLTAGEQYDLEEHLGRDQRCIVTMWDLIDCELTPGVSDGYTASCLE
jgi:hypothetical protein